MTQEEPTIYSVNKNDKINKKSQFQWKKKEKNSKKYKQIGSLEQKLTVKYEVKQYFLR